MTSPVDWVPGAGRGEGAAARAARRLNPRDSLQPQDRQALSLPATTTACPPLLLMKSAVACRGPRGGEAAAGQPE